jgi:hypothetical protein
MQDNHTSGIQTRKEAGTLRHAARVISWVSKILVIVIIFLVVTIIALATTGHEEIAEAISAIIFYGLILVIILFLAHSTISWFGTAGEKTRKLPGLLPCMFFLVLSLCILGPLLGQGYILRLDMVFTPHLNAIPAFYGLDNWEIPGRLPFMALVSLADNILPGWVVQKIFLIAVLFSAGFGAYRLFPSKGLAPYFCGILYAVNPFVYYTFLKGQWGVLASYAVLPFVTKAVINMLTHRKPKDAIIAALLVTVSAVFQVQSVFLVFLIGLFLFIFKVSEYREWRTIIHTSGIVLISVFIALLINSFWIIPTLTSGGTLLESIHQADLENFAPQAGSWFDVALMFGSWRAGSYTDPRDLLPVWWLISLIFIYLAIFGFLTWRKHVEAGWAVKATGLTMIIGLVFSAGILAGLNAFEWIFDHVFWFRAFRDSYKFVALICLGYAFLGACGVARLSEMKAQVSTAGKKLLKSAIPYALAIIIILPMIFTFTIFGFNGQLKTTDFPDSWYEVNEYLNRDEDDFNVLFLPWHLYMDFSWLPNEDQRLANPAYRFFNKPVISGDNIEIGSVYTQSTNPVSAYVEAIIADLDNISDLGNRLVPLNVKYIILAHEVDYTAYQRLDAQADLVIDYETDSLTVYRNTAASSRLYTISTSPDVTVSCAPGDNYVEKSSICYEINGGYTRRMGFILPQRTGRNSWEFNGESVDINAPSSLVFNVPGEGGELRYSRFYKIYLPSYIMSGLGILGAFVCLSIFWKKRALSASDEDTDA